MKIFITLFVAAFILLYGQPSHAFDSCGIGGGQTAHCGIYICLPGGFPSSCYEQEKTFTKRIAKKDCSALPSYKGCGGSGSASLSPMGYEPFYPCAQGYRELVTRRNDNITIPVSGRQPYSGGGLVTAGACIVDSSSCVRRYNDGWINIRDSYTPAKSTSSSSGGLNVRGGGSGIGGCDAYKARLREKPFYYILTINNKSYPKSYFQFDHLKGRTAHGGNLIN